MEEKRKPPQWLYYVVIVPTIFLLNLVFDVGIIPAVLIGAVSGGAISVIIYYSYSR